MTLTTADRGHILPILDRLDTLLGRGNTPEALAIYCDAVRELWPDMTLEEFARAMRTGIREVDVSFKLTVATIAKFIRRPLTRAEANAEADAIRERKGGGMVEPHELSPAARRILFEHK